MSAPDLELGPVSLTAGGVADGLREVAAVLDAAAPVLAFPDIRYHVDLFVASASDVARVARAAGSRVRVDSSSGRYSTVVRRGVGVDVSSPVVYERHAVEMSVVYSPPAARWGGGAGS